MELFILWFLIPASVMLVLLLIFLAFNAIKAQRNVAWNSREFTKSFEYQKSVVLDVHKNVNVIGNAITESLIPQVESIYKNLGETGKRASIHAFFEILVAHDFSAELLQKIGGGDPEIFVGVDVLGLEVTILLRYNSDVKALHFSSFSNKLIDAPNEFFRKSAELNESVILGAIGVEATSAEDVLFVNYSLLYPKEVIDEFEFIEVLRHLAVTHGALINDLRNEFPGVMSPINLFDYVRLQIGDERFENMMKSNERLKAGKQRNVG